MDCNLRSPALNKLSSPQLHTSAAEQHRLLGTFPSIHAAVPVRQRRNFQLPAREWHPVGQCENAPECRRSQPLPLFPSRYSWRLAHQPNDLGAGAQELPRSLNNAPGRRLVIRRSAGSALRATLQIGAENVATRHQERSEVGRSSDRRPSGLRRGPPIAEMRSDPPAF